MLGDIHKDMVDMEPKPYNSYGDWVVWGMLIISIVWLITMAYAILHFVVKFW